MYILDTIRDQHSVSRGILSPCEAVCAQSHASLLVLRVVLCRRQVAIVLSLTGESMSVCICGPTALELYRNRGRMAHELLDASRTGSLSGCVIPSGTDLEDVVRMAGVHEPPFHFMVPTPTSSMTSSGTLPGRWGCGSGSATRGLRAVGRCSGRSSSRRSSAMPVWVDYVRPATAVVGFSKRYARVG